MLSLSVCIITKNEAKNIQACLNNIAWADEIIIIDSESTDQTVPICQQYTDKIVITPYKGCGPQKKQAFEMATRDWVLMLDADEHVTPELQLEIKKTLQAPKHNAYKIPFQTFLCGKALRFGDCLCEHQVRLIKRDSNTIVPRIVHSRIETIGSIGKLKHKILHYSFPNLEKTIRKMNTYSTDGALHLQQKGQTATLWTAISHGLCSFIRGYILRLGFLDGKAGFMFAVSNAEGAYYKYLKLSCLN